MSQRRFGPTRAAGVAIIELEGDKEISPGALGWAGHAGLYEKGPVGELVFLSSKTAFSKKMGGYIPDSQAPDAAIDYFDLANGAGGLLAVRVTDGNEVAATLPVFARIAGVRTQVGLLSAKNGGRWGGKEHAHTADYALSGDLTEITLATGVLTWKADQLKGGSLVLAGVPNKTYAIVGNSAAGLITVAADSKMATDYAAAGATSKRYYVTLSNVNDIDPRGGRKALSVRFKDGEDSPSAEFAMDVFVDGVLAKSYPNLSMDSASSNYWVNVVNNDTGNDEVTVTDMLVGSPTAAKRPANVYGLSDSLSATVLAALVHEFLVNSPGGGDPAMFLGALTDAMLPQTITLTMTSPTAFTAVSDRFGSLGSPGTLGTPFTPNNVWTPPFTVYAGDVALSATDTLIITYKPLKPGALAGGKVYPDKASNKRLAFAIASNDHSTITAAPGSDMTAAGAIVADGKGVVSGLAVGAPTTPSSQITGAGNTTWNVNVDAGLLRIDGATETVLASADLSVHAGTNLLSTSGKSCAASIVASVSGGVVTVQAVKGAEANTGSQLAPTAAAIQAAVGPGVSYVVLGNTTLNRTGDLVVTQTYDTSAQDAYAPIEFLVEAAQEFSGGRDGHSNVVDATWQQKAWDTALSPFNRTDGKNLGLVKFATPGVTSTAVQKAGQAYATAKNHQYRIEVPSNVVDEQSCLSYVDDTIGRTEFSVVSFPSYAYVADPQAILPGKLKLTTQTGAAHGREARTANDYGGYHKAAAGIEHVLPKILKLPTGDAVLNEELLNPDGIGVIKKLHGNHVLWGDRTLHLDPTWRWKHQREQMSYYEHVLQEGFDWIVFAINDPVEQKIALAALKSFFLPEFAKRALRGKTFDEACSIKIDAENNTNATMAAGDMNAKILLRLADTVERFVISVGRQGVFDSAA